MALATRPKPNAHHRKSRAQHHRKSKHYLRPYWPYLPMLVIVGSGALVNHLWQNSDSDTLLTLDPQLAEATQPLARIQLLAGDQVTWAFILTLIVTALAFAVFVFRHWYRLHRLINKGERFVHKHPKFDIALVCVFTAGFVLTRYT